MQKRTALLILFALVFQAWAQVTPIEDDSRTPLVSVNGKGRVRVRPDFVEITVGIDQRGKTVKQLQDDVDAKSASIISYLKRNGVKDRDVQTSQVNLSPYYSYTGSEYGSTQVDFYTATKSVTFVLRDISRYEKVLSGLYKLGVNTVSGINFKVDDAQAQKQEAKRRAVAQARKIAEALTEGLNVTVGKVYSLDDQTYDTQVFPIVYAPLEFRRSGSDTTIAGGEVEVTATVAVSFQLMNEQQDL